SASVFLPEHPAVQPPVVILPGLASIAGVSVDEAAEDGFPPVGLLAVIEPRRRLGVSVDFERPQVLREDRPRLYRLQVVKVRSAALAGTTPPEQPLLVRSPRR